jgi:AcrR family transcriptional regulator
MNSMSTDVRKYHLKARAERQRRTRERIVRATAELHQKVGPARTTIADIARRAGVQRLTVYNNFPELADLLAACQGHFLAAHPPPDILPNVPAERPRVSAVRAVARLEAALADLYRWYRDNQAMERNLDRDRHLLPELDQLMRASADPRFDVAAAEFARLIGGTSKAASAMRPLVRLALDFGTWQRLAGEGLSDRAMARLMRRAVAEIV